MIEPQILNDPYVQSSIYQMIRNRINEAKVGVLKVHGNYSIVSGDPFSLCQHIFGLKVTGLLKSGEIYNKYWCDQHAERLACYRAPMTCHNNIRLVFPHRSDEASHWYQYMTTCTIFNSWDTAAHALNGMDKDGDLVMLTDNKVLVDNLKVLPALMCVQRKAKKKIVTEADAIQANIDSFGDDIGKTTNWITSMFDVQAQFQKGSKEYEELDYDDMYKAGKKCCNGVRWKNSTQRFEMHLFSGTARRRRLLLERKWIPGAYVHFTISERGKTRPIDAPRIQDRQVHKVYTKKVLLPLYRPEMIYNNGASLEGKGFEFSKRMLKEDLRWHFRRYGRDGNVILIDFKQFFPSVSHEEIFKRHEKLLLNPDIRKIGDDVVNTVPGRLGLPLGVEPSQAEMIAFPSALDNFIKCQLSIKCAGHYMDDYYVIVPPDRDAKEIMALIVAKAESLKLTVSKSKSRIVPLTKPFRYCKAKFILTETGRVVMNGNRDGVKRARRKIKAFRTKIQNGEMSYDDLWTSVNGMLAYFESYDDHNRVLRLRRLFYSVFGFSPERIENFRERGKKDEICCA